jgi:predicted RNA binding protein YcfA (HicA-like mRNA interferase family)
MLDEVLSGRSDQTIRFDGLRGLLAVLGFQERVKGSHHIFTRVGVEEIINLQPRPDGTAKQVRNIVTKYQLGLEP